MATLALIDQVRCPACGASLRSAGGQSRVIGVEYASGCAERYDGVSEWRCPDCGVREGRWSRRRLAAGELERRPRP